MVAANSKFIFFFCTRNPTTFKCKIIKPMFRRMDSKSYMPNQTPINFIAFENTEFFLKFDINKNSSSCSFFLFFFSSNLDTNSGMYPSKNDLYATTNVCFSLDQNFFFVCKYRATSSVAALFNSK